MAAKPKKPAIDVDKLTKAQAKVELMRLALEIEAHNERYYQNDAPSVSDAEYDALRQRNDAIEARFPELVTGDSPSQKVGAAPSGRFAKVQHAVPMLSLGNAFSDEDVADFVARVQRFLKLGDDDAPAIVAEPEQAHPLDIAVGRVEFDHRLLGLVGRITELGHLDDRGRFPAVDDIGGHYPIDRAGGHARRDDAADDEPAIIVV